MLEASMSVVALQGWGGPEVLVPATRPVPRPSAGEALIEVVASGVNRPDVLQRQGLYPPPPGASDIPGLEVAGRIVAGDVQALSAAGLALGDSVCALISGGGYAQFCVAPVGQCLPVPEGWSFVEAASLPETVFTVWYNVFERGGLQPGETVLVHGGASGIGVTAIQLAKAWGARVIVTAGSEQKCQACLALGADHAINHRTQVFEDEVMRFTSGQGANLVLDMVAGDYIGRNVACLAGEGRIVVIAHQGGKHATLDISALMRKRLTLTGSTLRSRSSDFKSRLALAVREQVWPWLHQRVFVPVIHSVFPADQAAQAHLLMESGQHVGKLVLVWPELPRTATEK